MPNSRMLLLCGVVTGHVAGQSWSHNPAASNGPLNWGSVRAPYATCGTTAAGKFVEVGAKQTPIDIENAKAAEADLPSLR